MCKNLCQVQWIFKIILKLSIFCQNTSVFSVFWRGREANNTYLKAATNFFLFWKQTIEAQFDKQKQKTKFYYNLINLTKKIFLNVFHDYCCQEFYTSGTSFINALFTLSFYSLIQIESIQNLLTASCVRFQQDLIPIWIFLHH